MQPRVRQPNAGRPRAFLREPGGIVPLVGAPEGVVPPLGAPGGEAPEGAASLDDLRRTVARIEGRVAPAARLALPAAATGGTGAPAGRLALGVAAFDGLFAGGGLATAALTELRAAETRAAGALTGFLAALAVRLGALRPGPLLWVREDRVAREAGRPAALGLLHLGLDPARLVAVEVREPAEALWAAEEGLACPGLSGVVCELQGLPRAFGLTAGRRLSLRARHHGLPLLLACHGAPPAASAAAARIAVAPRPSVSADGFDAGPGHPAWTLALEKNRDGRTGRADLAWHADERRFHPLEPLPVAVAAADPDRPPRPPQTGQVVAYPARRAG